ncbi:hypothetical protein D9_0002 [Aeromonas phage D9]|nr:hypothetical protein D9_0002 [Aeromonas phage D9]
MSKHILIGMIIGTILLIGSVLGFKTELVNNLEGFFIAGFTVGFFLVASSAIAALGEYANKGKKE